MADRLIKSLTHWLVDLGLGRTTSEFLVAVLIIICIAGLSILFNYLTKKAIHTVLKKVIRRTRNNWDDILFEHRVFHRFSHIAPAVILYYSADQFLKHYKTWLNLTQSAVYIYVTIVFMIAFSAFLSALNSIYMRSPSSAHKPIKGYLQVVNIFNYSIGIIIILSILLDKDPSYFLTGIGAIAAVLLIVFKDSLLGLVAGIQLSANDMVKIGDWITVPSKGVDGVVTEISLHTVKVENFDKTLSYIPSYTMVSEAFVNWRGMELSRSRRIRRSLIIDLQTIRYMKISEAEALSFLPLAKNIIEGYQTNQNKDLTDEMLPVTNAGLFRMYCEAYLREHPAIKKDMTLMVRDLQPTAAGFPIEIYCFCNTTEWQKYEEIQAGIFEHFIAVIPQFGLKIFQNPAYSAYADFIN